MPVRVFLARLAVRLLLATALAVPGIPERPAMAQQPHTSLPVVIGHRGACGYRPEHTLASYELAIDMGADFIEPDLVPTRDGALIARHENEISGTSDVAEIFPDRRTTKTIDGVPVTGFFTEDFTLAEIKTLRARERLPFRDHGFDGRYQVPTFEEIVALARRKEKETGRVIGLYPETKHPTYFRAIGLPLEPRLVEILRQNGYDTPDAPVCIQSFEWGNLRVLRQMTPVPLVFLIGAPGKQPYDLAASGDPRTYGDLTTPAGLASLARFASGIGPDKRYIVPQNPDGSLGSPTRLVADAHAAGLFVHAYTFRNEPRFLAPAYAGDPLKEYLGFYALGVDGVFSDFPDTALAARTAFAKDR